MTQPKTIRIVLSLFLLVYGAMHIIINYYYPFLYLDTWLLPLGLSLICLSFLFWPHKYHREKTHILFFGTAVCFIYLSAVMILLAALYLAASSLNVARGFYFVSPLILLATLLYFVARKITRKENLTLF